MSLVMIVSFFVKSPVISIFVSHTFQSFTIFFERLPSSEITYTSPSSSDMIFTAFIGRRKVFQSVFPRDWNIIVAVFPIYFSPFWMLILTVERRLAFDTLETAVIIPVSIFHSVEIITLSHVIRVDAKSVSISITTCGSFPENSATALHIFTACHTFAITFVIFHSIGADIVSFE